MVLVNAKFHEERLNKLHKVKQRLLFNVSETQCRPLRAKLYEELSRVESALADTEGILFKQEAGAQKKKAATKRKRKAA